MLRYPATKVLSKISGKAVRFMFKSIASYLVQGRQVIAFRVPVGILILYFFRIYATILLHATARNS